MTNTGFLFYSATFLSILDYGDVLYLWFSDTGFLSALEYATQPTSVNYTGNLTYLH